MAAPFSLTPVNVLSSDLQAAIKLMGETHKRIVVSHRQLSPDDPSKTLMESQEIHRVLSEIAVLLKRGNADEEATWDFQLLKIDATCLTTRANVAYRSLHPQQHALQTPSRLPAQVVDSDLDAARRDMADKNQRPETKKSDVKPVRKSYPGFVGIKAFKAKQATELANLTRLANAGKWESLQTHSGSGFDWWMFPLDFATAQHREYRVSASDIEELKEDEEFMASYRKGVILVARSWGWDIEKGEKIKDNPKLKWVGYQVRLGKMLNSLQLFGQKDLHDNLVKLIKAEGVSKILPSREWHPYLEPI